MGLFICLPRESKSLAFIALAVVVVFFFLYLSVCLFVFPLPGYFSSLRALYFSQRKNACCLPRVLCTKSDDRGQRVQFFCCERAEREKANARLAKVEITLKGFNFLSHWARPSCFRWRFMKPRAPHCRTACEKQKSLATAAAAAAAARYAVLLPRCLRSLYARCAFLFEKIF